MSKHGSLIYQTKSAFKEMEAYGQSKHQDKISGRGYGNRIYCHNTMRNYLRESLKFINFAREVHPETKTLKQARGYVDEWLTHLIEQGTRSPASIALSASSVAKLYRCPVTDFRDRPSVTRANIKRSRGPDATTGRISKEARERLEAVTRTFMLRKCDLRQLRPEWLHRDEKGYRLDIPAGVSKGGRPREVYAHAPETKEGRERLDLAIRIIQNTLPGNKVFLRVHSHYYPHSDRAAGCKERYEVYVREVLARNSGEIPTHDRYVMRNSFDKNGNSDGLGGTRLSRSALKLCGQELGHGENREALVA